MPENPTPFSALTTMRVGGAPEELVIAHTEEQLVAEILRLDAVGEPWMVLGGGSNTIVSDDGFAGTVIAIRTSGIEEIADEESVLGRVRIRASAGEDWDSFVSEMISRGYVGLEALSGIPGRVGAAPIQNVGAYGSEIKDVLHSINMLDLDSGEVRRVFPDDLEFAYRDSALKRGDLNGVVLSVDFILEKTGLETVQNEIRFEQLARAFDCKVGDLRPISEIRERVIELRRSKGMVLDEEDHDTWSSGSFFVNPIVSERFARSLPDSAPKFPIDIEDSPDQIFTLEQVNLHGLDLPPLKQKERNVKLSAAWLIEQSGISKGFSLPGSGARVSTKHTLAITNSGNATAAQVAELARYIRAIVRSEFGVMLHPEPNVYGLTI